MTIPPQNPLDYQSRLPGSPVANVGPRGQFVIGCAASFALAILLIFTFFFTVLNYYPRLEVVWVTVFSVFGIQVAAVSILGITAKRKWKWPMFLPGLIIGTVLPLLAFGLCIAVLR